MRELNLLFEHEVLLNTLHARDTYFSLLDERILSDEDRGNFVQADFYYDCNISLGLMSERFISYVTSFNSYAGGAHGMYGSVGNNYFINPLRKFELSELFSDFNRVMKCLVPVIEKIIFEEYQVENPKEFYLHFDKLKPEKEYFDNYNFSATGLVFIYNPYVLTYYANGAQHPEISFDQLLTIFPDEPKLHQFIAAIRS